MKTSLRKLRGFALHKHGEPKDRRDLRPLAQLDELVQASQVRLLLFPVTFCLVPENKEKKEEGKIESN